MTPDTDPDNDFFAGRTDELPPLEAPAPVWHEEPGYFPWADLGEWGQRLNLFAHRFPYDWTADPQRQQQRKLLASLADGRPEDPVDGDTGFLTRTLFALVREERFTSGSVIAPHALALTRVANEVRRRLVSERRGEPPRPFPTAWIPDALRARAFWVAEPRFLAGAYPGASNPAVHAAKVRGLLQLHITHVVSLMEPTEVGHHGEPFTPYARDLEAAGVVVQRHAIRDVTAPSVALTKEILNTMDADLAEGGNVYVHCWGGRGRTGTIVGCWLVRHGWIAPRDARTELDRLRAACADAHIRAPDTAAQLRRITSWEPGL